MNNPHEHYTRCYDNTLYHNVQMAVLQDIHGELPCTPAREEAMLANQPTTAILNAVIDAALEISGLEHARSALRSLMLLALQHNLSDETIRTIADHLCRFERPGDNHTDDLVTTIAAIRHANSAEPVLHEAIRSTSDIHSKQGRCAYHLLTAAHGLTETAMILLKEGETSYMQEKWHKSQRHLDIAVCEKS